MASKPAVLLALCCVGAFFLASAAAHGSFTNTNVKRRVTANYHVVRVKSEFTIDGSGDDYVVCFPDAEAANIAHITAVSATDKFTVSKRGSSNGFTSYNVHLAGANPSSITVISAHSHALTPFPAEITQMEKQFVLYEGSAVVCSPYQTNKQVTTVKLPKGKVESYSTTPSPASKSDNSIKYGEYKDVKPFSHEPIRVHFENNSPFVTFTNVDKEIEVSHWGNIAVEEQYDLKHTGASLKGGFARIDYQMRAATSSSFRSLTASLPATARDIYYRDIIGNISTSRVREGDTHTTMEIETRFPVFGGWKTQWYQGYNIPSSSVLDVDGNEYTLSIDFGLPYTHKSIVTDSMTLKVILPEGASVSSVDLPSTNAVQQEDARRFTYLDSPSTGRPVLTFSVSNYVVEGNGSLKVVYTMPPMAQFREVFMLISSFFLVFLSYSILSRIDLSIVPSSSSSTSSSK